MHKRSFVLGHGVLFCGFFMLILLRPQSALAPSTSVLFRAIPIKRPKKIFMRRPRPRKNALVGYFERAQALIGPLKNGPELPPCKTAEDG
jgi:hypothetical protein